MDIGPGLGTPSIPIAISIKFNKITLNNLKIKPENFKFTLIEPNQKKCKFLQKISDIFDLKLIIENTDEKTFYAKYRKKFDIVFCRAVFPPPKIFDVFKKYTQNFAFWQYSQRYKEILLKYEKKIITNHLQVFKIFNYQILDKEYYTTIFLKSENYFNG